MAAIEHIYQYAGSSVLEPTESGFQLNLAAEQSGDKAGLFFDGALVEPLISANCLRAVSDLVGTRFYVPPGMLARILREADPVATVGQDCLRFEGFSACCSTYIRHDIDPDGFRADTASPGTTNVDFRDDMRGALAQVRGDSTLRLTVGSDAVGIAHEQASVVERKVPLPIRWLKGFAEVQIHLAGMTPAISLSRVQAQRFLRDLPRGGGDHAKWLVPAGGGLRFSAREIPDAVRIKGARRLRVLERLANAARGIEVYYSAGQGSSAWVLDFGTQRLTLVLNSEPWRGFSGDGQLLSDLAQPEDVGTAAVRAQLGWQAALDRAVLAKTTGLSQAVVDRALARLAASGQVGFDLQTGAYFHRVLPFDLSKVEQLNPRLKSAQKLVQQGAVTLSDEGAGYAATINSGGVQHQVKFDGQGASCTCPWYAKHQGRRGPCKHVLAAEICAENLR